MPEWVMQLGYVLLAGLGFAIIVPLAIFSVILTWLVIRAWFDAGRKMKGQNDDRDD